MNQRIQALALQAGYTKDMFGVGHWDMPECKKFAELIVQECMWKIMVRKEEAIDNNWNVDEAMSAALSDISEHFGVEP
jgi:hypothetical protein